MIAIPTLLAEFTDVIGRARSLVQCHTGSSRSRPWPSVGADLAQLYGVETRAVVQAVKRNAQRFPADFMFQLDAGEWDSLRSQTVISNAAGVGVGRGGRRTAPCAFTEQGVVMLSSVLGSERAVAVNIEITDSG